MEKLIRFGSLSKFQLHQHAFLHKTANYKICRTIGTVTVVPPVRPTPVFKKYSSTLTEKGYIFVKQTQFRHLAGWTFRRRLHGLGSTQLLRTCHHRQQRHQHNDSKKDPDKEDEEDKEERERVMQRYNYIIAISIALSAYLMWTDRKVGNAPLISWTEMEQDLLKDGKVKKVTILRRGAKGHQVVIEAVEGAMFRGRKTGATDTFVMFVDNAVEFEQKVINAQQKLRPEHQAVIIHSTRQSSIIEKNIEHLISWTEFTQDILAHGEVDELTIQAKGPNGHPVVVQTAPGAVIRGYQVSPEDKFVMYIDDIEKFEQKVRNAEKELGVRPEHGIPINYSLRSSVSAFNMLVLAVIGVTILSLLQNKKGSSSSFKLPNMIAAQRKARFMRVDLETAKGNGTTFKDVAGLKEAKVEVMEFVDYLKRPERYVHLGGRIPHGALLTGPPGCGKTLIAKALAAEAQVPFLAMAGSEFVEMIGGLGAARVRDLFKEARERSPCIIYIDEVDAIGRKRGRGAMEQNSEEEHTLNQLLVEMDGIDTTAGVIMIASTNRADVLDNALLRPGRFDRHILIDLPTLIEREEIFEMYLKRLSLKQPPSHYSERLAQLSPGMSGADIANICNEAALYAARFHKKVIDVEDFEYAVERVIAGVAKKSRLLSPLEKKIVAYHEAGHAVTGWLLQHTDPLLKVSIVPRVNSTLGFAQYMPQDKKLHSKEELFERMCMALGGRVAESITFNSITSGAQDDLERVTRMAYDQVRTWGFNEVVGCVSFAPDSEFGVKPYSKKLAQLMDQESKKLVESAYKSTHQLLSNNKEKLRMIAESLVDNETLNYNDVEQLIGPPPHNRKAVISPWEPQHNKTT